MRTASALGFSVWCCVTRRTGLHVPASVPTCVHTRTHPDYQRRLWGLSEIQHIASSSQRMTMILQLGRGKSERRDTWSRSRKRFFPTELTALAWAALVSQALATGRHRMGLCPREHLFQQRGPAVNKPFHAQRWQWIHCTWGTTRIPRYSPQILGCQSSLQGRWERLF